MSLSPMGANKLIEDILLAAAESALDELVWKVRSPRSSFEAMIGVAYFLRIFSAIRKRQNGIVLNYAESRG
jgi:hypothetical protein